MKPPGLILPKPGRRRSSTMTSREISVFVSPEALFPGIDASEATMEALLGSLSRDAVLVACARLNTVVSGTGDPDTKVRQERAIGLICSSEDLQRINAFAQTRPPGDLPIVFFRGQLLELMRWAVRCCPATPDFKALDAPAARSRLLQAALIASTFWSKRVFGGRLSGTLPVDEAREQALGPFRRGLEESMIAPYLGATLGRGWALFSKHFPEHYPTFSVDFLEATGLTVEQYFTCVTGLALYLPFDSPDGLVFNARTLADATAYRDVFSAYMASESQTPEELAVTLWEGFAERGYRDLRERPILALADGRAVIIDPVFFSEKISVGPLFHLLPNAPGKANEIFGAFGLAFEDYANGILQRMYPDRPGLASRLRCGVTACDREGRDFEIDAVLNYIPQTVIFEEKAAWLKDEVVLGDVDVWIEQIRSRYGIETTPAKGKKKERPKGVAQLAQIVRRVLDGNCGVAQPEFADVAVIHPVLLVHDTRLNAPAYGTFLDAEFRSLLGDVPQGKRVMPLAIMTIADLEYLESSVVEFGMRQLLSDYAEAHPDGLVALHNFMVHDERYADKLKPSAQLIADSERLIRLAQRELFPDSPDLETLERAART